MIGVQADIACFTEINTDTNQYRIRDAMEAICRRQFEQSRLIMSASKQVSRTAYKPGGTAILATNSITANIRHHSRDRMGRWSSVSLSTNTSKHIRIISAYQVCAGCRAGTFTASSQQYAQIMEESAATGSLARPTPRQSFISDLQQFINQVQQTEDIILVGDFNEEMSRPSSGIDNLATNCSLADVFSLRLSSPHVPATYQRGNRRIDFALISPSLIPLVRYAGYDPFGYRIPSDHRGFYIDFATDELLGQQLMPLASASRRDFDTSSPEVVHKYVTTKLRYLDDHQFFVRLRVLADSNEANHDLAESLDRDLQRASRHAANQCSRRPRPPWSPKLAQCWATLHFYRLARTQRKLDINLTPAISKLQNEWPMLPREIPVDDVQIKKGYDMAAASLKAIRLEAQLERDRYLQEKAATYAMTEDTDKAKIIHRILRAENLRRTYRKLRTIRNLDAGSNGLSSLKVPKSVSVTDTEALRSLPDTPDFWETVTLPTAIEKLLLKRNQHHFGQADGTPFTRPPLQAAIGYKSDGYAAEMILKGQINFASINEATALVIKHLQSRTAQTLDGQLTQSQIREKINKWKESTTTSPSGIHLGHYRCMCKHLPDDPNTEASEQILAKQQKLLQATTTLLNYSLRFGYTFERWKTVVNILLQKDINNPRIHRLRVIHIYEADYNLLLAIKWRQAMHYAEDRNLLNDGLYGSRPHRSAHDPVIIEVLQNETYRMSMKSGVNFDLDASSCYDRILVNVAALSSRRMGMHPSVVQVNANTLENAKYYLKTQLGISNDYYSHTPDHPIHGTGQGSGNSPFIWCFVCSALFDAFEEQAHGATFTSFDRSLLVPIYMMGFVDDCSQRVNKFDASEQPTAAHLLHLMEQDVHRWKELLWASGGMLELSKCSFHLIQSDWNQDGHPFLNGCHNSHSIHISHQGITTRISQMSNYQSHKTLGCYVNPAHSQKQAFKQTLAKNERLAQILESNYLSRSEAWVFYNSIYLPSITYPLALTPLSQEQCAKLDIRILKALLPRTGFNRNMAREIRYAPRHLGGANFRQLYVEQGVALLKLVFKYLNSPQTTIGKLLRITMSWTQAFLGISEHILTNVSAPIPPVGPSWLLDLRQFLRFIGGSIQSLRPEGQGLLREHDAFIMDVVLLQSQWSRKQIIQLNACRRYFQALTLADIVVATGTRIKRSVLLNHMAPAVDTLRVSPFNQRRPGQMAWATWRRFLRTIANPQGVLNQPLGRWTAPLAGTRHAPEYIHDPVRDRLYSHHNGDTYVQHERLQPGRFALTTSGRTHQPKGFPTAVTIRSDRLCPSRNYLLPTLHTTLARPEDSLESTVGPDWARQLLHNVETLQPVALIQKCISHGDIVMCSDGSVTDGSGSYGFTIASRTGQRLARGNGAAPGSYANSFRSEAYGILATLLWLNRETQRCTTVPPDPAVVYHYLDNRSVISRVDHTCATRRDNPNRKLLPEQDVIDAIHYVWRKLHIHVYFKWVKSHQDADRPIHQLTLEAQLNCEADQQAASFVWPLHRQPNSIPFLPHTPYQLSIQGRTITGKMKQKVYELVTTERLMAYLCKRFHWDDATCQTIDWSNFSHTLKKYTAQWVTIVKHVHEISPTGHIAHRNDIALPHECPACGSPEEDNVHVLLCPAPSRANWRTQVFEQISKTDRDDTDPYIIDILQDGLRRFHQQAPPPHKEDYPQRYHRLLQSQESIGWKHLYMGRWSLEWSMSQDTYKSTHPHKPGILPGTQWTLRMSRILIDQWLLVWTLRNTERHKQEDSNHQNLRKQVAQKVLTELYGHRRQMCPNDTHIFYTTVQEHLAAHPIHQIEAWIQLYHNAIKASINQAKVLGIQRNRSLLEYPGFNPITRPSGQASLTAGLPTG
jgi:hypothetical protein